MSVLFGLVHEHPQGHFHRGETAPEGRRVRAPSREIGPESPDDNVVFEAHIELFQLRLRLRSGLGQQGEEIRGVALSTAKRVGGVQRKVAKHL